MIRILLNGCLGRMGRAIAAKCEKDQQLTIVAGVDSADGTAAFPVYSRLCDVRETADILLDFSHYSALDSVTAYALSHQIPLILATTGYKNDQIEQIKQTSLRVPVFFTFNMSIGINLLVALTQKATAVLGNDFDVEIIEKHHNQKLDAPSGTALMLAKAVEDTAEIPLQREYDRHARRAARPKNEIGIHSVRGGNIVGEHEVIFAGTDELITLSHTAYSRDVFANGALKAASFLVQQGPGLYDMSDVLSAK